MSSFTNLILIVIACLTSFYLGTLSGMHSCLGGADGSSSFLMGGEAGDEMIERQVCERMIKERLSKEKEQTTTTTNDNKSSKTPRFGSQTSRFIKGAIRTTKSSFINLFDYGIPVNPEELSSTSNNNDRQEALILYNNLKSIPSQTRHEATTDTGNGLPLIPDASIATSECDTMNVIYIDDPDHSKQCLALVGEFQGYHVQRWMRVPEKGGKLDHSLPLRFVSRGYQSNGKQQFIPPHSNAIQEHHHMLNTYLQNLGKVLKELKPIAEKVARNNTIVVMTCNMGQSELLMNFACSAKARGLDVSHVLVFPTDEETKELAESLGLTTFYDRWNFAKMPTNAAKRYGDRNFVAMMYAKVVCVQLINFLEYDLLFQDVDLVWYKDPLPFFQNSPEKNLADFDIYFQDDGAHSIRYAPLSANTGFYFVRFNKKTRYLFTDLLYKADFIRSADSHQQVLVALLNEHSSLFGLRVKVLARERPEFPGGWQFHRKNRDYMRNVVHGKEHPFIFHMSWTHNKDNKIKFFQQLGEWYLEDGCIQKKKGDIAKDAEMDFTKACCMLEPRVVCHYRDKPSKIPCKDSPPIDSNKPSWW